MYLLYRSRAATHWCLFVVAILMFALATGDIGLTHYYLFRDRLGEGHGDPAPRLRQIYVKMMLYLTSNLIADVFLIFRCYMVWGRRKRVITVPTILLLVSTVFGFVFQGLAPSQARDYGIIFLWLTFALNTSVASLIAFQIWWMSRELSRVPTGPVHTNKCCYIIAIVMESGALYPIYVLISVVVKSLVLRNSLAQVVGIVPTMVIIQIGLGGHTHSAEKTINSLSTNTVQQQTEIAFAEGTGSRDITHLG
ncbi:hypothetical protein P691DRAFT_809353 [Macrolepiota fuliginosa MF-IS2]|uniref:Uncharacterized protein n=1 Tax=Macrolepiota fuliginosa MF-IS2 TaxID=1400762 RepID=A0A9P5XH29_9AGAR|nr:hypothetical protein P691DRAFT_809353 [Macrolepiota fuliginosa MF-IS2]